MMETVPETKADVLQAVEASDRLALRGIYVSLDETTLTATRDVVMDPPSDLMIEPTKLPQRLISSLQASSHQKLTMLQEGCSHLGYSMASELGNETSVAASCAAADVRCIVPVASSQFSINCMKLSPSALQELMLIDDAISKEDILEEEVTDLCDKFLERFGSHVNCGDIHFGGVCRWTVVGDGVDASCTKVQLEKSVFSLVESQNSQERENFSLVDPLGSAQSSVNTPMLSVKPHIEGGPGGDLTFDEWEKNLHNREDSWSLVDRGPLQELMGVWHLLHNHEDMLTNRDQIEILLQRVWREHSGLPDDYSLDTIPKSAYLLQHQVHRMEQQVSDYVKGPTLSEILQHVQQSFEDMGSHSFWVHLLTNHSKVSDYLLRQCEAALECLLECQVSIVDLLLPTAKVDFPGKSQIIQWLQASLGRNVPSISPEQPIESLQDFINLVQDIPLRQLLLHQKLPGLGIPPLYIQTQMDAVSSNIQIEHFAMKSIHSAVHALIKYHTSVDKSHELCLIFAVLIKYKFQIKSQSFSDPLDAKMLGNILVELKSEYEKLDSLGQCSEIESHLVSMLMNNIKLYTSDDGESAAIVIRHLQQMKADSLVAACQDLCPVERNNTTADPMVVNDEDDEEDIYSLTPGFEDERIQQIPDSMSPKGLLDDLGLRQWYKRKISVRDVMSSSRTLHNSEIELCSLPWRILFRLITIDYRCREDEVASFNEKSEARNPSEDEFDSWNIVSKSTNFNPLDVFLVTFQCCDLMLQQTVVQKMHQCRLALPFIYPMPDNKDMLSLWALRGVIVEWQGGDEKAFESSIVKLPISIVSAIRFGRPQISKSKILCQVLSDANHATFFHCDCPQGQTERSVSNNYIETAFFLPSGKSTDTLQSTLLFLNLRGDGKSYKKQVDIIKNISSVVIVFLDITEFQKEREILQAVCELSKNVILVISCTNPTNTIMSMFQTLYCAAVPEECRGKVTRVAAFNQKGPKNEDDLKKDLRRTINMIVQQQPHKTVIESLASYMEREGVVTDEKVVRSCENGQRHAERVLNQMQGEPNKAKASMFPLQENMWVEWATTQKKLHRQKRSSQDTNQLALKLKTIRSNELEKSKDLPQFMITFITILHQVYNTDTVLYFIEAMKLSIDQELREILPNLEQSYQEKWQELNLEKEHPDCKEARLLDIQAEIQNISVSMQNASFGIENIFREIGQIYEANKEGPNSSMPDVIKLLPRIAATLLLKGVQLEIMNGESTSVPLTWLTSVFGEAQELLKGKKLFVLSILGVQSSGKSTFLNAMFGIQLNISAGRCTHGASIQLVPLPKKQNTNLPFDYVIILDTEGLRAPELGFQRHEHDNELATMAIGLSDIAIMNIKGENYADINDILQIAVQSFLRMRLVSTSKEQRRKCLFVHQNVPAVNAKAKMSEGLRKLQGSLDELTAEAASIEGNDPIKSFSQVIDFSVEKHVWYLSDLWHGDPPMAPANPGYSERVQEVKNSILYDLAKHHKPSEMEDIKLRLTDLWKAVLTENFVFFFRNSLAIKAYQSFEGKLIELCWEFECQIHDMVTEAMNRYFTNCNTIQELDAHYNNILKDIDTWSDTQISRRRDELLEFLEGHRHKDIMIQWQDEKNFALQSSCRHAKESLTEQLHSHMASKRLDITEAEQREFLQNQICEMANKLAEELKGSMPTDKSLQERFDQLWNPWQEDLGRNLKTPSIDIADHMEKIIYKHLFEYNIHLVTKELKENPLGSWPEGQMLHQCLTEHDIKAEHYVSLKPVTQTDKLSASMSEAKSVDDIRHAVLRKVNGVLLTAEQFLKGLDSEHRNFDKYGTEVVYKILHVIKGLNEDSPGQCRFKFLPEFTVKLVVMACGFAVFRFNAMQEGYLRTHSIQGKLQRFKNTLFLLFKHKVKDSSDEVMAIDLLVEHIGSFVCDSVAHGMTQKVVGDVLRTMSQSKYHLIGHILESLARGDDFEEYMKYIDDSESYAQVWLEKYINTEFFGKSHKFGTIAESALGKHIKCIADHVHCLMKEFQEQKQDTMSLETWLEQLKKVWGDASQEGFPVTQLTVLPTHDLMLADSIHFTETLHHKLLSLTDHLMSTHFSDVDHSNVNWHGEAAWKRVFGRLWGCPAQCHFCHEPCMKASEHPQSDHQCLQHRPQGVTGIRETVFNQMITAHCNHLITTYEIFFCQMVKPRCEVPEHRLQYQTEHEFKQYRSYMPKWDIAPDDVGEANVYWNWFVYKYQDQLKEKHGYELPPFPDTWPMLTMEQAIESLKTLT